MSAIEQAAREIAEDIDFGELSETHIRRLLRSAGIDVPATEQLAAVQRVVIENHERDIAAILRKHFGPSEPRIIEDYYGQTGVWRDVLVKETQALTDSGEWATGNQPLFPTSEAAEDALAKSKEQP